MSDPDIDSDEQSLDPEYDRVVFGGSDPPTPDPSDYDKPDSSKAGPSWITRETDSARSIVPKIYPGASEHANIFEPNPLNNQISTVPPAIAIEEYSAPSAIAIDEYSVPPTVTIEESSISPAVVIDESSIPSAIPIKEDTTQGNAGNSRRPPPPEINETPNRCSDSTGESSGLVSLLKPFGTHIKVITDFLSSNISLNDENCPVPQRSPQNLSPTYSMVSFYPFFGKRPKIFPYSHIPCLISCTDDNAKASSSAPSSQSPKVLDPGQSGSMHPIIPIMTRSKTSDAASPRQLSRSKSVLRISFQKNPETKSNHSDESFMEPGPDSSQENFALSSIHQFSKIEVSSVQPELTSKDDASRVPTEATDSPSTADSWPNRFPAPSMLAEIEIKNPGVNIEAIRESTAASFDPKSPETNFTIGISGIKNVVEMRSKMKTQDDERLDFIDYFAKKDGYVYIETLETLFDKSYQAARDMIKHLEYNHPGSRIKSEEAKNEINEICKIYYVKKEKELQDFDFPSVLEKDIKVFDIDYTPKLTLIAKLHDFGVQTILHYVFVLAAEEPIPLWSVHKFATELMADIAVLCYGLFIQIAEFMSILIEQPSESQLRLFTLDYLIQRFRNLVATICDEIGAIGQSCSQVIIRIMDVDQEKVEETLLSLYEQVNFAYLSIGRAMEALVPSLHLHYITNILKPKNYYFQTMT